MTARPLVNIIIDNFNYAPFLRAAIDSALVQTYPNLEIVVVDDGSTDDSRRIIASYGDRIVPILKDNGGQASAFNAGFNASRGEIVCFLDADDALAPTAVELAVPHFSNPSVVKVHWPLWETDSRGEMSGKWFPASPLDEGDLLTKTVAQGPLAYITSPASGNAWARSYLEKVLPVAECGNKHGADAYLSILAPVYGRIEKIDQPQGQYRIHNRSFSGNQRYRQRVPKLYAIHCRLLAEHLAAAGIIVDTKVWKKAQYVWQFEMKRAARELRTLAPPDSPIIVIDGGVFANSFLRGRRAWPFLERDGQFWGPPADDATAIAEFERMRAGGADFVAVAWPAFWWLDYYTQFATHLRDRFDVMLENDRLVVFDLRTAARPLSSTANEYARSEP
jgi:hypothetical protein